MSVQRLKIRTRVGGLSVQFMESGKAVFSACHCIQKHGKWYEAGSLESDDMEEIARFLGKIRFALYIGGFGILKRQGEAARRIIGLGSSVDEKYLTQDCSQPGQEECVFICRRELLDFTLNALNDSGLFPASISIAAPAFLPSESADSSRLLYHLACSLTNNNSGVMRNKHSRQQRAFGEMKQLSFILFPLLALSVLFSSIGQSAFIYRTMQQTEGIARISHRNDIAAGTSYASEHLPLMTRACFPLQLSALAFNPPDRRELEKGNFQAQEQTIIKGQSNDVAELLQAQSRLLNSGLVRKLHFESLKSQAGKALSFTILIIPS
jgi:hypothetical protein